MPRLSRRGSRGSRNSAAIVEGPERIQPAVTRRTDGGSSYASRARETRLDKLDDPRSLRGRRWPLAVLLRAVLVALVAGCKSLAQAEALTAEMSAAARKRLGIARRIADTTMRDLRRTAPRRATTATSSPACLRPG